MKSLDLGNARAAFQMADIHPCGVQGWIQVTVFDQNTGVASIYLTKTQVLELIHSLADVAEVAV